MPSEQADNLSLTALGINLEQYTGLWAVDEAHFAPLLDRVRHTDLPRHLAAARGRAMPRAADSVELRDGIAVIEITGTLTKRGSSFSDAPGMTDLRRQIRTLAADDTIIGLVLLIDSPGGTVAGTLELAEDVYQASRKKPVTALIEDLGASAAYWIASQAREVYATSETSLVGSIGTYMSLWDTSVAYAKEGMRPVVISSGGIKGMGGPGQEIKPEYISYLQEMVNTLQDQFSASVSRGRKISAEQMRELADGRLHTAPAARERGLIDGIRSLESAVEAVRGSVPKKGKKMQDNTAAVLAPATYHDLKAACVGADPAFLTSQLEANATVAQASAAWMGEQNRRIEAANQAQKAAAEEARAAKAAGGLRPLGNAASGETADATAQWETKVTEACQRFKNRQRAIAYVADQHPELHRAYIAEYNATHR